MEPAQKLLFDPDWGDLNERNSFVPSAATAAVTSSRGKAGACTNGTTRTFRGSRTMRSSTRIRIDRRRQRKAS
jgi:hypothetical protein